MGSFTFDGKRIPFEPGDTLGAALHRSGVLVLSRSLKYHRPRGLYCNQGSCGSCLVDVDGVPNTPACLAACRDDAKVVSQNRLGSARHDLYGLSDKVFWNGFDPHDAFTRPRILNEAFLKAIRMMSGLGRAPPPEAHLEGPRRHTLTVDELVVGGGHAGLTRVHAAAKTGASVLLIEEGTTIGGSARWHPMEGPTLQLAASLGPYANLTVWTGAICFGLYRGDGPTPLAAIQRPGPAGPDLWEVTARRITLATGRHDAWPLFTNNDLPGILSLRGALRLLGEHGVRPGRRVVVHGAPLPSAVAAWLETHGVQIAAQGVVEEAKGGVQVERARIGSAWHDCDAILSNEPTTPRVELFQQAGCKLGWSSKQLGPAMGTDGATSVPGIFAAVGAT